MTLSHVYNTDLPYIFKLNVHDPEPLTLIDVYFL